MSAAPPPVDLVIYDCDGTLIDSEIIAFQVDADALAEYGIRTTAIELAGIYAGMAHQRIVDRFRSDFSLDLPPDFLERTQQESLRRLSKEARALPDVPETLEALSVPFCLATSAHPVKLDIELNCTGLARYFAPEHIFRADMVRHSKPAPDLFLLAAERMGAAPDRCLALEDSVNGIAAAVSAGMLAIGFTGGSHCGPDHAEKLRRAGASHVISRHSQILDFI